MNKINHASVDPCRREKWDILFACLELSRLKYPEECENGMHFPFYINLCERSQFIFGHAGVISHSLYCNSFYPTSEKKVKSWVNSLKSDMFKMQNTCYSLFKFCLISQQQWGNSGKHLFFPSGVVVGSICQPFFLLKYCTCSRLFVSSDGEGRMLIRATALPLAHFRHLYRFFLALVGEWMKNVLLSEVLWANGFPKHRGTKVHTEERGRTPGPTWI